MKLKFRTEESSSDQKEDNCEKRIEENIKEQT